MMGIISDQHRFNFKVLMTLLLYWSLSILYFLYLLREANEFREYMDTTYLTSATTLIAICYMNLVWKMENLFQHVDEMEKIFENSEHFIISWIKKRPDRKKMN